MSLVLATPLVLALAVAPRGAVPAYFSPSSAQDARSSIVVRQVLAVERAGQRLRLPVYTDAIEAAWVAGTWSAPEDGQSVRSATGDERTWARFEADAEGWFTGAPFDGGWAWAMLDVPAGGFWRLNASGHSDVLVDGEPHVGDGYVLGTTRVPLFLTPGKHELLFRCGRRGRLRATLEPAPAPLYLEEKDRTLPDLVRGERSPVWLGTIVSNAGGETARGYRMRATAGGVTSLADVPPLLSSSMRKCALALEPPPELGGDTLDVHLELLAPDGALVHSADLRLNVREPGQLHTRTFRSAIDDSVQYFSVVPPTKTLEHPALVLSLHGAGVEGRGQAACYEAKDWAVVVAPTNRRPFGFDWEDWGRLDALEVLQLARTRYGTDPRRTYLTGHSMGGHGTWQLGAQFPELFAAIAPSAGWRDFWSYTGLEPLDEADPIGPLLDRAANASHTALLLSNYARLGVFVLHGDADDDVPVREARTMREALGHFHPDFVYEERPGAGHWWGNQCLDWPPLIDFLGRHAQPEPARVLEIDFTSVDASVSSRCHWLAIEAQTRVLMPSRVHARLDPGAHELVLDLENVSLLALDLAAFSEALAGNTLTIRIGDSTLEVDPSAPLLLGSGEGGWQSVPPRAPWYKSARRAGPFKAGFRHRFLFVYGTHGTPEENAWALAKARFDHEQWRYRGNGSVDVLADTEFRAEQNLERDVILYGNADTNGAWDALLGPGAFELCRGSVRVGTTILEGEDLALLAVYPRRDCDLASVVVIGGTGATGARATTFLPYFVSGVGYPDWTVIQGDLALRGLAGVRGAGYFRADWSPELGAEAVWR